MLRVEVDRKEDAENESDDEITMETNEGEFCYPGRNYYPVSLSVMDMSNLRLRQGCGSGSARIYIFLSPRIWIRILMRIPDPNPGL